MKRSELHTQICCNLRLDFYSRLMAFSCKFGYMFFDLMRFYICQVVFSSLYIVFLFFYCYYRTKVAYILLFNFNISIIGFGSNNCGVIKELGGKFWDKKRDYYYGATSACIFPVIEFINALSSTAIMSVYGFLCIYLPDWPFFPISIFLAMCISDLHAYLVL